MLLAAAMAANRTGNADMDNATRPHGLQDTSPSRERSRSVLVVSMTVYGIIILAVAATLGLMWTDMLTGSVGDLLLASR